LIENPPDFAERQMNGYERHFIKALVHVVSRESEVA
jgi:hypothetical protein